MKTKEIKNRELRQQVENLENGEVLTFDFPPKQLLDLGWVFDDSIDYYFEKYDDISQEEAEQLFNTECIIYVRIEKLENDEFTTTWETNTLKDHYSNISNGMANWTGDDEATIDDIIFLIN